MRYHTKKNNNLPTTIYFLATEPIVHTLYHSTIVSMHDYHTYHLLTCHGRSFFWIYHSMYEQSDLFPKRHAMSHLTHSRFWTGSPTNSSSVARPKRSHTHTVHHFILTSTHPINTDTYLLEVVATHFSKRITHILCTT